MLKIWGRVNSINVQKVMWCVGELGLAHERVDAGGQLPGDAIAGAHATPGQAPRRPQAGLLVLAEAQRPVTVLCRMWAVVSTSCSRVTPINSSSRW